MKGSHFYFDTKDTLPEHNVSDSIVNIIPRGLTRVDHESVGELHGLGTSGTQLAGNDNLTTLCTRLHDETKDTVASPMTQLRKSQRSNKGHLPTDSKTTEQLISQALALRDGRESTVLDLFGIQFKGVFGELETLLNEGSEFTDATALLTKDLLSVCCTDDNLKYGRLRVGPYSCMIWMHLSAGVGYTNITARVTLLCELAGEEFIEFGAEDTVCDKLALFADLGRHLEAIGWAVGDISPESIYLDYAGVIQLHEWPCRHASRQSV